MTRIEADAWLVMLAHARRCYPEECCGAMLGRWEDGARRVTQAVPLVNAHPGPRRSRYQVRPEDLLRIERRARQRGLELLGIYHSHPDSPAYFSSTDLRNSCPWYCFVVLSICRGRFAGAGCWLPNQAQSAAVRQELRLPKPAVREPTCP